MKQKFLKIYINTTSAPVVVILAMRVLSFEPIFNFKKKRGFLLLFSGYISAFLFHHLQPARQKVTGNPITDITNNNI